MNNEFETYLESLRKFAVALENFGSSSHQLRKLVGETGINTMNLIKELNKRGADIEVKPSLEIALEMTNMASEREDHTCKEDKCLDKSHWENK